MYIPRWDFSCILMISGQVLRVFQPASNDSFVLNSRTHHTSCDFPATLTASNFDSKQLPPSSIICFQSNFLGHRRANSWTISFGPLTVEPLCPGTIQWTSLTSSGLPPYSLQCEPQPRGGLSSSNFSLIWILFPTTPKVFFFSVYFFLVHSPLFQSLINNYFH